jgi:hypothetical protein
MDIVTILTKMVTTPKLAAGMVEIVAKAHV